MGADNFSGLKVLVAEDSPPMRLVIKTYLGKLGISPQFAENGQEALRMLNEESFDLAFVDVHMPEKDGREVVKKIRKQGLKLPIIAVTTADDPDLLQSCIDSGYNSVLPKPIVKEDVFRLVEKFS
ncbi:response regulator [Desulfovibrio sp. JC010]|uniref:response regulator n=1 Tax=Desulfovibrio sp. JC010 TaxID=2593641 RepID=UPI0013D2C8DC|nr:response regulator [Desulfovibrio sp. JC010]NDV25290.1 response regulator [Desulfovibrio sp. JC010]